MAPRPLSVACDRLPPPAARRRSRPGQDLELGHPWVSSLSIPWVSSSVPDREDRQLAHLALSAPATWSRFLPGTATVSTGPVSLKTTAASKVTMRRLTASTARATLAVPDLVLNANTWPRKAARIWTWVCLAPFGSLQNQPFVCILAVVSSAVARILGGRHSRVIHDSPITPIQSRRSAPSRPAAGLMQP